MISTSATGKANLIINTRTQLNAAGKTLNASPMTLWTALGVTLLVLCYVMFVMNHLANPALDWDIPLQRLTGDTVDISIILRFPFLIKFIKDLFYCQLRC
jgi:hypothetical protein